MTDLKFKMLSAIIRPTLFFDVDTLIMDLQHTVVDPGIDGDIVEFGCYEGNTSKMITVFLDYYKSDKKLYVYDSFEGLPPPDKTKGDGYNEGDLHCTVDDLIENFKAQNIRLPKVVKGWFNELKDEHLPDKIAYALLDGDNYSSIKDSLHLVWDKIPPLGLIGIHDYHSHNLRGAKLAVDEFMEGKNHKVFRCHKDLEKGNDIITIQKYA